MTLGLHLNMDADLYHSNPAVSVSRLKRFERAPCLAHHQQATTEAMRFGSIAHSAVLEGHLFDRQYVVTDVERRGTKAWAEAESAAEGKTLLKRGEYDTAMRLRDAAMAHPVARGLLGPGLEAEVSVFWKDQDTGLACRGRMDGLRRSERLIVDLKKTTDARAHAFGRQAAKLLYHWQAAFYLQGIAAAPGGFQPDGFVFIAIEGDAPHLLSVFELDMPALESGADQVRDALRRYAECVRSNDWPGYYPAITQLSLPDWATGQLEDIS